MAPIIILLIIVCCCCVCISSSSTSGGFGWYNFRARMLYNKYIYTRDYDTVGNISIVDGKDDTECANICNNTSGCNAFVYSFEKSGRNLINGKCALKKLTKDDKYTNTRDFNLRSKDYLGDDLLIKNV
jgi:hypothetical protein